MVKDNFKLYEPLSLMVSMTDHCPFNCYGGKFCSKGNNPRNKTWIPESKLVDIFKEAKGLDFLEVCYVGSEPFLDFDRLERMVQATTDMDLKTNFFVTNGFFGDDYCRAEDYFQRLKKAGFRVDHYGGNPYCQLFGLDVSIDMFHTGIQPEHAANVIVAYLDVFGPTKTVNIRSTVPAKEYDDPSNLNKAIAFLKEHGGEVVDYCRRMGSKKLVFPNGSEVIIGKFKLIKHENSERMPNIFEKHKFTLDNLVYCKDLHFHRMLAYHMLYVYHSLNTYPEFVCNEALSGGNLNEISLRQAIKNIDNNPLLPLYLKWGVSGPLRALSHMSISYTLPIASQPCDVCAHILDNKKLVEQIKHFLVQTGREKKMRTSLKIQLEPERRILPKLTHNSTD